MLRDPLARFGGLQPCLLERDLRSSLGGAGLIDLLGCHKATPEQRLHPSQRTGGERALRFGGVDAAFGGIGLGSLRRNLIGGDGECRLQSTHRRARLVHAQSVGFGVDAEQHLALANLLVVAHIQLDDPTADIRRHVDDVGLQIGVVSARRLADPVRYEHSGHKNAGQRHETDEHAQRLADCLHRSMAEPEQPGEERG